MEQKDGINTHPSLLMRLQQASTSPLTEPEKLTQKLYRRRIIRLISSSYLKAFNELDFPIISEECEIMGAIPIVFN